MYNGIGLTTPRGSGTNGYVQANKAHVRSKKDRVIEYQSEEEIQKAERLMFREPNKDILEHERKRRIEAKCFEMRDLMEEQGYKDSEIEEQVSGYRDALLAEEFGKGDVVSKADIGKPLSTSTHALAAAAQEKNDQLKTALNISSDFKDGSSLQKKAAIRKEAEQEKAKWIESDESSSSSSSSSSSDSSDSDSDDKNGRSPEHSPKTKKKPHSLKSKKKSKKSKKKKSSKKKSKKKAKEAAKRETTEAAPKSPPANHPPTSEGSSPEQTRQLHSTVSDKRKEAHRDHRPRYSDKDHDFHDSLHRHGRRPSSRERYHERQKDARRSRSYDDFGPIEPRRAKHVDRHEEQRHYEESHASRHSARDRRYSREAAHHHHGDPEDDYDEQRKRRHERQAFDHFSQPHYGKRRK